MSSSYFHAPNGPGTFAGPRSMGQWLNGSAVVAVVDAVTEVGWVGRQAHQVALIPGPGRSRLTKAIWKQQQVVHFDVLHGAGRVANI